MDLDDEVLEVYDGSSEGMTDRFAEVGGGALGLLKRIQFKALPATEEDFLANFEGKY